MAKQTNQKIKDSGKNYSTSCAAKGTNNGRTAVKSRASGVVAYTKGSRFKDTEVQAAVQRVLKKS